MGTQRQRHPQGRWARFLEDVRLAEGGERLVGLGRDHVEVDAAMRLLEREWAREPIELRPPEDEEPVVIEVTRPPGDEKDDDDRA